MVNLDMIFVLIGSNIVIYLSRLDYLKGQIDVINKKAVLYADDDVLGSTYHIEDLDDDQMVMAIAAYDSLVEALVDADEEIGLKFIEEEEITIEDVKLALRRATIANKIIPVVGGSAFKDKGIQYLVDAVVDYLPSPLEIPPAVGLDSDDEEKRSEAPTNDNGKFWILHK